jgi:hypothetical protein
MEKINIDWCKKHDMAFMHVNVATDTSYYLEKDGNIIFVYTQSTIGEQRIYVRNPLSRKEAELIVPKINRDLDKLNILTTDDLNKLCNLVDLEYHFK